MLLITPEGALLANNLALFVLTKATYSMFYLADILALRHIVTGLWRISESSVFGNETSWCMEYNGHISMLRPSEPECNSRRRAPMTLTWFLVSD